MMLSHQLDRPLSALSAPLTIASVPSGSMTSAERPTSGPKNPRGVTPTIVNGFWLIVSVRPITSSVPPKRRSQNP
jgi:hypothetical protein